jgi:hypothetical protein
MESNNMKIQEHNSQTGEVIEREMNAEEISKWEASKILVIEEEQRYEKKLAAKAALLEKLGITEDEAKLLLS